MPSYELNLIVKRLPKASVMAAAKRAGEMLLDNQSIIRRIEFLGTKQTPYTLRNPHNKNPPRYSIGSYFIFHMEAPAPTTLRLVQDLRMDSDLISVKFVRRDLKVPAEYECTLEEELQPPPHRKSVLDMIREGRPKDLEPKPEDPDIFSEFQSDSRCK